MAMLPFRILARAALNLWAVRAAMVACDIRLATLVLREQRRGRHLPTLRVSM